MKQNKQLFPAIYNVIFSQTYVLEFHRLRSILLTYILSFSIQISYRGKLQGVVKSRIVKGQWKSVLKSILRGDKSKTLAKKIVGIEALRKDIHLLINGQAAKESKTISKLSDASFLRNSTGKDLCEMDMLPFIHELKTKCPVLHGLLESVMGKSTSLRLSVAAAVLLFNRNNHLSAIHHVIGQILDQGGATDEVITNFKNIRNCVSFVKF